MRGASGHRFCNGPPRRRRRGGADGEELAHGARNGAEKGIALEWIAVAWAGFVATMLQLAYFGLVHSLGLSRFSPTVQLGCIFVRNPRSPSADTLGYLLLVVLGSSVVPLLYALVFEAWSGPSWRAGLVLGAVHGLLAAAALPGLGTISACIRSGAFPAPGPFGVEWGKFTPANVLLGHLLYGGVAGAILAGF